MVARIDAAKAAGDTLGGVVEVVAFGLPVGLGLARVLGHASWTGGWRRRSCRFQP